MEKGNHAKINKKKAMVAILISNKAEQEKLSGIKRSII